jgi:pyridoxine/pyridoxamine 5'-phosphate oxidase
MISKQDLYDFMNSQPLMVVSTLSKDGKPQGAVVGFGQTRDLELVFGTSELSRKAQNIKANSAVAVVIGWSNKTIQLEGTARLLSEGDDSSYSEQYFLKNKWALKYKDEPHERHFVITPTWLKVTDTTTSPWDVAELEL